MYDDIKSADEQIRVLRSNMQTEEDANNVLTLERENKKRLLQLLRDCSEMADFTNYNPQNEAFLHSRTSRAISQNETYRRNTPYPPLKNRPAYAGIHIL